MWLFLKNWEEAETDLTAAKDIGIDIAALFYGLDGSVEDFERKNKVKMPENIAVLLRRELYCNSG